MVCCKWIVKTTSWTKEPRMLRRQLFLPSWLRKPYTTRVDSLSLSLLLSRSLFLSLPSVVWRGVMDGTRVQTSIPRTPWASQSWEWCRRRFRRRLQAEWPRGRTGWRAWCRGRSPRSTPPVVETQHHNDGEHLGEARRSASSNTAQRACRNLCSEFSWPLNVPLKSIQLWSLLYYYW